MEQAKALFDMGEHAVFIWSAYGVCAAVLALLVFSTLRRIRDSERRLQALSGERRERSAAPPPGGEDATPSRPGPEDR